MHNDFLVQPPVTFKISHYRSKGVESNVSRLARCAWVHQIPVNDIFTSYLGGKSPGRGYFDYEVALHFNHYTDKSVELQNKMYKLVGGSEDDFHCYSFLNDVLDPHAKDFIAPKRKWCRDCYTARFVKPETKKILDNGIFDDLYWSMNSINICMLHGTALSSRCHYCKFNQPYISTLVEPGYCHHCRRFLGAGSSKAVSSEELSRQQLLFFLFYISTFDEFLPQFDRLMGNIKLVMASIEELNEKAICDNIGRGNNIIRDWSASRKKPKLADLFTLQKTFRLCGVHQLFMAPNSLIFRIISKNNLKINVKSKPVFKEYKKRLGIESFLKEMIDGHREMLNQTELAIQLNVSEKYLLKHFSQLCNQLATLHRFSKMTAIENKEKNFALEVDIAFAKLRSGKQKWTVQNLVAELPAESVESKSHQELFMALNHAKIRFREAK